MSRRQLSAGLIVGALVLYAVCVPWLNPQAVHRADLSAVFHPPGLDHLFGTDQLGRDLWVRSAQALRLSLLLAAASAAASTLIGVGVGVLAAYAGGIVDRIAMRLVDTLNAVPHLLLSVVVLSMWPGRWWAIVAAIALTHWTQVARIVRSRLISERESQYVALSRAAGARPLAIWVNHLIPAVAPQAAIALVLQLPHAIWHESALSFLGVGLPPQAASLGLILEDARGGVLSGAWWLLVIPAGLLVLLSAALSALAHESVSRSRTRRPAPQNASGGSAPTAANQPAIEVRDLRLWSESKAGVRTEILHELNYQAKTGRVNVILGPSGVGKTMLLRAMAGVLPPALQATGSLFLHGARLQLGTTPHATGGRLAFVPGSAATALNPVRTVGATMRRELRRQRRGSSAKAVGQTLERVGLDAQLRMRFPHELSGGQAQRVLLGLALLGDAQLILLDEPTSALDPQSRQQLGEVLQDLARAGRTVVMVTHDLELAAELADEVSVVQDGRVARSIETRQEKIQ
ncbi:ABC transporter permease subunit [Glutamicibacter sp. AOP12-B1-11]|uniref:ABC transporter permease subunit n=1 Tax=Glutamicibacter sp. AOP12-B1-11 TaxID=3457725 RepID=UPI0040343637